MDMRESSWKSGGEGGHTEDQNEVGNVFLSPQTELNQVDSGPEPGASSMSLTVEKSILTYIACCWEERTTRVGKKGYSSIHSLINHLSDTHQTLQKQLQSDFKEALLQSEVQRF